MAVFAADFRERDEALKDVVSIVSGSFVDDLNLVLLTGEDRFGAKAREL